MPRNDQPLTDSRVLADLTKTVERLRESNDVLKATVNGLRAFVSGLLAAVTSTCLIVGSVLPFGPFGGRSAHRSLLGAAFFGVTGVNGGAGREPYVHLTPGIFIALLMAVVFGTVLLAGWSTDPGRHDLLGWLQVAAGLLGAGTVAIWIGAADVAVPILFTVAVAALVALIRMLDTVPDDPRP